MKRQRKRKRQAYLARAQRKRDKRRAEMKRRHRGKREVPRGLRNRQEHSFRPVVAEDRPILDVTGWLDQRRQQRRQQRQLPLAG